MPQSNWPGMSELIKLFDTLPADAEDAIKEELPKAAGAILALEKNDVAVRTGDLWRGLTIQTLNDGLKVRAGLIGAAAAGGRSNLFYGRIVELGRKAQVVLVERRRRVGGKLRTVRGRKVAADIVKAYNLTVRAEPPRPFVDTPQTEAVANSAVEAIADIIQSKMQG